MTFHYAGKAVPQPFRGDQIIRVCLASMFFLSLVGMAVAQPLAISDMNYDSERWVMSGRGSSALLIFDGEGFLSLEIPGIHGVWKVGYDEKLGWTLAVYNYGEDDHPDTKLYRLMGYELEELGAVDIEIVDVLESNGEYWLIAGLGEKTEKLLRFSNGEQADLSSNLSRFGLPLGIEAIAWVPWERKWLIGGVAHGEGRIISYDGESFEDLSDESGAKEFFVGSLACNEEYCLIAGFGKGYNKLLKYSQGNFTDLTDEARIEGIIYGITWTGEYWILSGTEAYLIYDGEFRKIRGFPVLGKPVGEEGRWLFTGKDRVVLYNGSFRRYCDCFQELSVEAGLTDVTAIDAGFGGWLIATSTSLGEAGSLTYLGTDGARLLYRGAGIRALGCSAELCLAGGKNVLLLYNGTLTVKSARGNITAISWFEKEGYWLLGSEEGLFSYDGELRSLETGLQKVTWLACKEYCLVAIGGRLLRFDGVAFEDITRESGVEMTGSFREVDAFDFGDGYWLVGGRAWEMHPSIWYPFLRKYNGSAYETLEGYTRGYPDIEYNSVTSVRWNGKYFLVATASGRLFKYANGSFEELTNNQTLWLRHRPNAMAWNGSTWLLGGRNGRVLMYDGDKFEVLHEAVELPFVPHRVIEAEGYPAEKAPVGSLAGEGWGPRGLAALLGLLVIALAVLAFQRRGRR